jgi:phosphotransferase system HPr (HPr) family protein
MTGNSQRQTVTITNPQGFHMRPILAFVEVANRFPGTITVTRSGKGEPVNGRSILGLLSLGAEEGSELVLEVNGPGAAETVQALQDVLRRTFDDDQSG